MENQRELFENRERYREKITARDLKYYRVTRGESNLLIATLRPLVKEAEQALEQVRGEITREIARNPAFLTSFQPVPLSAEAEDAPKSMGEAARIAGTGPMAAVAGEVARRVGKALRQWSPQVVVENGGDIFLAGNHQRIVAISAGNSPLSMKLGLSLLPGEGTGVSTSSGTLGHSFSAGRADAAVVVAKDAALADAVATMLGNLCDCPEKLASACEWAAGLPRVEGAVAILKDKIAVCGGLELVKL